jgi:hypothetical protein
MSAINDALLPMGVQCREVPASPNRLWALMHQANILRGEAGAVPDPDSAVSAPLRDVGSSTRYHDCCPYAAHCWATWART